MAQKDTKPKGGLLGWVTKKLIKDPCAWIGVAAGTAVAVPTIGATHPVGGTVMAIFVGLTAALVSKGVHAVAHSARAAEQQTSINERLQYEQEREQTLQEKLRAGDLNEDADLLTKIFEARDAIFKRCDGPDVSKETSAPTLDLMTKITHSASHRAEELLDLSRRVNDPLLDSPANAERTIADCRADLVRTYQAIADSRSRILLHREPSSEEFLESGSDKVALGTLAEQLEQETSVLEGIDRRLRGLDLQARSQASEENEEQDTSTTTYGGPMQSE